MASVLFWLELALHLIMKFSHYLLLFALLLVMPARAGWGRRRRAKQQVCNDVVKPTSVSERQCNPVTMERTAWRNVTRWKKVTYNRTIYVNATRVVNLTETVNYTLPLEDFFFAAKDEIVAEAISAFKPGMERGIGETEHLDPAVGSSEGVAHIVWGPSQAAKSTTICQLRRDPGDACPEIGDGDESQTDKVQMWDSVLGYILDTIGLGDSKLRFSKEEIGELVATAIGRVAADIERVKFLVFQAQVRLTKYVWHECFQGVNGQ